MRLWLLPVLACALAQAGAPARAADAPPGASSCTGCHARTTIADSVIPRIAGRRADEFGGRAGGHAPGEAAYRSGAWPSSVMGRIAKGFDDRQTAAIAAWFAVQPE
jgi:cytochrome c553